MLPGIYCIKANTYTSLAHTYMFIAALLVVAKNWRKKVNSLSIGKWLN